MSEEKLTSNTLEIEENRRISNSSDKKESYKPISEDIGLEHVSGDTVKNSNMVRENGESASDGADEKMLGSGDKEALALKNIEVKFVSGEQNINGDAKIEIGNIEKAFTGMTKDELMKYANDPFWVKLRWILFIAFWGLWVAMLAGAVAIIVLAPKCAAPTPLAWYEKGPLIKLSSEGNDDITKMEELNVQGVIYELPAEETYNVENAEIQTRIKRMVKLYHDKDIKFILDLTPNYVPQNDSLFVVASQAEFDAEELKAFVTTTNDLNWRKVDQEAKAFEKIGRHSFLSQFGKNIDLRMDNKLVEEKFKKVLSTLVDLGVKGFRLLNAKHFIIKQEIKDEGSNTNPDKPIASGLQNYNFYSHLQSTYVDGLGDLLQKYAKYVHNITNGEGFLTTHEPLGKIPEAFIAKDTARFGMDLPKIDIMGLLNVKGQPTSAVAAKLFNYFTEINTTLPTLLSITSWMQLEFNKEAYNNIEETAYYMFVSLLRGVQIAPLDAFDAIDKERIKDLASTREKTAIQHGSFDFFLSQNNDTFGYARIKSGNPGYFVVLNPSTEVVKANFTTDVIGSEMEVFMLSANFKDIQAKAKYMPNNIDMPAKSTAIFTFVPK